MGASVARAPEQCASRDDASSSECVVTASEPQGQNERKRERERERVREPERDERRGERRERKGERREGRIR